MKLMRCDGPQAERVDVIYLLLHIWVTFGWKSDSENYQFPFFWLSDCVNTLFDTSDELVLLHVGFFLIKTQTHTVFHCSAELLRDSSVSINELLDSLLHHKTPLFIRSV